MNRDATWFPCEYPTAHWQLTAGHMAKMGLFVLGLCALAARAPGLALTLWVVCLWLDWRALAHVRALAAHPPAPAEAARIVEYVRFRAASAELGHVIAAVLGVYVATRGNWRVTLGLWAYAGVGTALKRALVREAGAMVTTAPPPAPPGD